MSFLFWPILAVWMGLGLLVGFSTLALLAWCGYHVAKDRFFGSDGDIWCPVHRQMFKAHGTPRAWRSQPAFTDLWRCQPYGEGRVTCKKTCLRVSGPVPITRAAA